MVHPHYFAILARRHWEASILFLQNIWLRLPTFPLPRVRHHHGCHFIQSLNQPTWVNGYAFIGWGMGLLVFLVCLRRARREIPQTIRRTHATMETHDCRNPCGQPLLLWQFSAFSLFNWFWPLWPAILPRGRFHRLGRIEIPHFVFSCCTLLSPTLTPTNFHRSGRLRLSQPAASQNMSPVVSPRFKFHSLEFGVCKCSTLECNYFETMVWSQAALHTAGLSQGTIMSPLCQLH